MPAKNLTDAFVKTASPINSKLTEYSDTKERGLCLRVTPNNAKAWTYRYRLISGEQKRVTLGKWPTMSLSAARSSVIEQKANVSKGGNPALEAKQKRYKAKENLKSETLKEIGEWYYRECDVGRQSLKSERPKRASTLRVERPYFDKMIIPALGDYKIQDIKWQQIEEFINNLTDNQSKSAGRHCRVILHSIYEFAIWKELAEDNPCKKLAKQKIPQRKRVLKDDELKAVWQTFTLPIDTPNLKVSPPLAYAIKIAAVTLQRRSEITKMHESQLDFENRVWTIPSDNAKNYEEHEVPLTDLAMELIQAALALRTKESGYVFPSPRATPENDKPIDGQAITHAFIRARNLLEWQDMRPHDLRRTGASNLAGDRLGFPIFTISKVLNHKSDNAGGAIITQTNYALPELLPMKRRALDAWAIRLLEIVESKEPTTNVISLAR